MIEHLEVETAENGMEACAKLGGFIPDIILTDLMMPLMKGRDFIEYIRKDELYQKAAIIVHSACDPDSPEAKDLEQFSIEAYYQKPTKVAEIEATVRLLMEL